MARARSAVSESAIPPRVPGYLHRDECYDGLKFPDPLRSVPMAVEGYGTGGRLIAHVRVIDEVMPTPGVHSGHLRNAEAGCFIARIERSQAR